MTIERREMRDSATIWSVFIIWVHINITLQSIGDHTKRSASHWRRYGRCQFPFRWQNSSHFYIWHAMPLRPCGLVQYEIVESKCALYYYHIYFFACIARKINFVSSFIHSLHCIATCTKCTTQLERNDIQCSQMIIYLW